LQPIRCGNPEVIGGARRIGAVQPGNYDLSIVEPIGQAGEVGRLPFPDRLRVLLSAAVELTAPQELEDVLQRIVEGAASVAGARYAALGVYGEDGRITAFVHHGFDEATVARIGHLPEGFGLLGQVIVSDRPVRLDSIGTDPRSCGFPAGHPPMRSFLGVPVVRGGHRYGNLYLTERNDGASFDDDDELNHPGSGGGSIAWKDGVNVRVQQEAPGDQEVPTRAA